MRIVCEMETTFKMIPQQAIARKKGQPTLHLTGTLVLQQKNFLKASERHLNSLGNHKYHSESGNPLCKRKENSCVG